MLWGLNSVYVMQALATDPSNFQRERRPTTFQKCFQVCKDTRAPAHTHTQFDPAVDERSLVLRAQPQQKRLQAFHAMLQNSRVFLVSVQ